MNIIHCAFSSNSAGQGGAIANRGGSPFQQNVTTVVDSSFTENAVTAYGGAIWNSDHASCRLIHSTFDGNTAALSGGAIYNSGFVLADLTIDSCTITGNSAGPEGGGAICSHAANDNTVNVNTRLSVVNSTFSGNSASLHGGGIYNDRGNVGSNTASATVRNSLFKTGEVGENLYNAAGAITSEGYNLSDDNGGGFLTAIGDQINTEPMLDPAGLQNNGGPTRTIALLSQSPAINSGDPNAPARDQRYYLRNGPPDKGAFEYGGTLAPLSVVSRKTHGDAGTFDVDLPLDGNIGVECRASGGNQQLIATFATPVTIGSASVTTGTGSVANASVDGSEVTMDLTGVSNAQQIVLTVAGVSDGANTNFVIIPMRVLLGDTNGNNMVNASDVSQTKSEVGQAVTSSNFRTDVNVNGTVNATDVAQVKAQIGTTVPIPLMPQPACPSGH